ncbi:MAG: hypothetical protein AAGM36_19910 [Cyanobacteria bacterium J06597_1]
MTISYQISIGQTLLHDYPVDLQTKWIKQLVEAIDNFGMLSDVIDGKPTLFAYDINEVVAMSHAEYFGDEEGAFIHSSICNQFQQHQSSMPNFPSWVFDYNLYLPIQGMTAMDATLELPADNPLNGMTYTSLESPISWLYEMLDNEAQELRACFDELDRYGKGDYSFDLYQEITEKAAQDFAWAQRFEMALIFD